MVNFDYTFHDFKANDLIPFSEFPVGFTGISNEQKHGYEKMIQIKRTRFLRHFSMC